tara:strand:- start:115 stop:711 length:597 start_codon:yes stop_codon:yes gene_type:complete
MGSFTPLKKIMLEFLRIIFQVITIKKSFFKNTKNFGEASIYFAILIIIITGLLNLIPQKSLFEVINFNYNLGVIKGPSIRNVIFFSILFWIIKSSYIYFVGVILFPNKKTHCNFRKILILVGYANVPMLLNFLVFTPSLLFFAIITYVWYNISLIVGLNIILNYDSTIKSTLVVLSPIIILFIYIISMRVQFTSGIIS